MQKIAILMLTVLVFAGGVQAASVAVGKTSLSGTILEWDGQTITAKGNASFVSSAPKTPLKPGTMRLESIKANLITLHLTQTRNKQTLKDASATGNVVIRAKRADQETNQAGAPVTVIRDVHAVCQSAVLPQPQETIKLTGNAVVKVIEPGVAEPVAVLSGETMTVSLKDNKIRVEGKPAEFTITPREEQK